MNILSLIFMFLLAAFLGFELINRVPSQLHTPLMSGSNAVSGISILGALVVAKSGTSSEVLLHWLGFVAIVLAMVNVVGGYLVTDRMLRMFISKKNR